jgi:hypothetical protein
MEKETKTPIENEKSRIGQTLAKFQECMGKSHREEPRSRRY